MRKSLAAAVAITLLTAISHAETNSGSRSGAIGITSATDPASGSASASTAGSGSGKGDRVPSGTGTSVKRLSTGTTTQNTPRKYWFQFFTGTYTYQMNLKEQTNALSSTYNYAGITYSLGNGKWLALRQQFSYWVPGGTAENYGQVDDLYLDYSDTRLATFGTSGSINGGFRVFFPTGELARFIDKRQGAVRATLGVVSSYKKLDFSYDVYGQYNNNSQEIYKRWNRKYAAIDYTFVHSGSATLNITNKAHLMQLVGTTSHFADTHSSFGTLAQHQLNLISSFYYNITDSVTLTASVWDDIAIFHPTKKVAIGRDDELTYVFSMAATL